VDNLDRAFATAKNYSDAQVTHAVAHNSARTSSILHACTSMHHSIMKPVRPLVPGARART
jgi:hypothetical protein